MQQQDEHVWSYWKKRAAFDGRPYLYRRNLICPSGMVYSEKRSYPWNEKPKDMREVG